MKTCINYGWIDGCSRSLNRSRILKFEESPDPDSKILEQERSRSLKMWLRPPQKFWNRSGVGAWKCDFGHLWNIIVVGRDRDDCGFATQRDSAPPKRSLELITFKKLVFLHCW